MKKLISISSFFVLLTIKVVAQETIQLKIESLTKNSDGLKEKERLELLSKVYMDYQLTVFPEYGTFIGKPIDNGRWTDMSFSAIEQRKKDISVFLDAIKSINKSGLDSNDQLNHDLLKNEIELTKQRNVFPEELLPMNQISGYHLILVQVAGVTSFVSKKDVEDYLSRLHNIPAYVDQLISLMD